MVFIDRNKRKKRDKNRKQKRKPTVYLHINKQTCYPELGEFECWDCVSDRGMQILFNMEAWHEQNRMFRKTKK